MTQLPSDNHRILVMMYEVYQALEVPISTISKATSAGAPFGAEPPQALRNKISKESDEAIILLSQKLKIQAEKLNEQKKIEGSSPVRLGGGIPMSTIKALAWEMLVRCNNEKRVPPTELLELLRFLLEIRPIEKSRQLEKLDDQRSHAALYLHDNPSASFRDAAKYVGVNVSTITRWNDQFDLAEFGLGLADIRSQIEADVSQLAELSKKNTNSK